VLTRNAAAVSEGLNERRREKGLRPRPVRAAVVGFPNVGKSALINRLIGRAQCASAARPGVTRHLQWVSLGAEGAIMLLDAPGVLPMRLADQAAAVRLAICNDIGEASYTTSLVAAQFIETLRANPSSAFPHALRIRCCTCADGLHCSVCAAAGKRMAALEARYRVSPAGLTGEAYVVALAERDGDGDEERAGRRLLVRRASDKVMSCAWDSRVFGAFLRRCRKTTRRGGWATSALSCRRATRPASRRGSGTGRRAAKPASPRMRCGEAAAPRCSATHAAANNVRCWTKTQTKLEA
jgi:hypothetical protein